MSKRIYAQLVRIAFLDRNSHYYYCLRVEIHTTYYPVVPVVPVAGGSMTASCPGPAFQQEHIQPGTSMSRQIAQSQNHDSAGLLRLALYIRTGRLFHVEHVSGADMRRTRRFRARPPRRIRQTGHTTNFIKPDLPRRALFLSSLLPHPCRPSPSPATTLALSFSRPLSAATTATKLLHASLVALNVVAVRPALLGLHIALYVFDKMSE